MRCKHSRVLSIIRERLHREPSDGNVFIVMSKNRRIVRMFTYDKCSYGLFEKKFVSGYNYSEDMPADQKDRYIHYLIDKVNELDLDKRAMELAVEEFQGIHNNVLEQLAELQKSIAGIKAENAEMRQEICNEKEKRKRAEAKAKKLDQQLKYAQKNQFGDKCQSARKDKHKEDEANREDEKYR